jgi:hypothetical protein
MRTMNEMLNIFIVNWKLKHLQSIYAGLLSNLLYKISNEICQDGRWHEVDCSVPEK